MTVRRIRCALLGLTSGGSRSVVGMTPEELADLAHLRRARDLMDREYAEPLDVPAMARAALMSPAHFSRKFRAAYGETPYSYLMTRRIERAKALLRQGMSVTDTCVAVGCTSLGSFSSRFTEIVGETPSQYRARDHRDLEVVPSCVSMVAHATAPHPASPSDRLATQHRAGSEKQTADRCSYRSSHGSHRLLHVHPRPRSRRGARLLPRRARSRSPPRRRLRGFRWVTVGAPGQDVDIVLFQPHGGRSQAEGDALLSLVTKGSLQAAIFNADDLDATFEKVRASGAEVLQEPTSQPWGARDCAFRDPSGNLVRIAQA